MTMANQDPDGQAADEQQRGRTATRPTEVPKAGWRDVLLRVKDDITNDTLTLVAAGVAFYALLAIFPAITAAVSIYGLVADPSQIQQQLSSLQGFLPPNAMQVVQSQLKSVASSSGSALTIGLAVSILISVYSASKGIAAMITALNIVYDEEESRGFIKLKAITLLLTLASIVFALVAMGVVIALPPLLNSFGLPNWLQIVVRAVRWLIMAALVAGAMAAMYRLAPSRNRPGWRWVSGGAVLGTVIWIIGSIGFSIYVSNFGSFNKTYGSAAAIVILMLWFWLSAFVVLLGAEVNSELERQTRRDTTTGRRQPLGERGAHAADTLGERP